MENITWGYICNSGPIHFYIPLENIIQSDGYIALTIPFEDESAIIASGDISPSSYIVFPAVFEPSNHTVVTTKPFEYNYQNSFV